MVVFDNGGSGASVLDSILSHGGHYLTRVKTNASDEKYIAENADQMVYVGLDAACLSRIFESSGRTVYLFFSSVSLDDQSAVQTKISFILIKHSLVQYV